ncbi:MAG TPA: hypothetical protein DDY98_07020 [Ruminococcaceae bacterium]|nr:hypothetical protein [Oscillospiraceae bacterium]
MKKNTNQTKLRFNTRKDERIAKAKRFSIAFACFFVLLGGISFLLLLKYYDFDLSKITGTKVEESSTQEIASISTDEVQGSYNFLLLCTSDTDNEVRFAAVLTADTDACVLSVSPIPTDKIIAAPDGTNGTVRQQLDAGGVSRLVSALEHTCSIDIAKYIRSTDSGFKSVINTVGGIVITVDKSIDVRSEKLTFIINEGEQTMSGDTLLKYLRYFEGDTAKQAEILAAVFRQTLSSADFASADRIYTKMINAVESDISVLDFEEIKHGVQKLIAAGEPIQIN